MSHNTFPHLAAILLRQRGRNQQLVDDIKNLLPANSQERLFRILQDMESEINSAQRKSHMYRHIAHTTWFPHVAGR